MKKKKIGDIVAITKGRKAQKVFEEKLPKAVRYIQIEDLRTDNKIQYTTDTTGTFVSMNDLCIAWDGANAGTVGYGLSGVIGSTIARLRINDSEIYAPYIGHFLQSKFNILNGRTTGTTIPHVERNRLEELEFSCRPLSEQRRVAAILDKVDAIRRKRQHSLKLTASLVKSQFIEMFGDPGTDPYGWGLTTLGSCCELNPRRPKNMPSDAEYSFVAMASVSEDGCVDTSILRPYTEVYKGFTYFAENDVLFAKITPCMENGKGGVATKLNNGIGFGSTEFHVLRPIKGISNPYWLYFITMFRQFRSDAEKVMTGTGGQRRVPITYLDEYKITLPPLELQNQFARFVEQADKSKFVMQNQLSEIEILLSALKQKFFA